MRILTLTSAVVIAALLPSVAFAQHYGPKGGVDLSTAVFHGSLDADSTIGAGLVGGGFITLALAGPVSFQAEVLVAKQTTTIEQVQEDRITYLQVPLLVRWRTPSFGTGMLIHAVGGGVWGRVLRAEETVGGQVSTIDQAIEGSDLGASIGADVEIRPKWLVDFRYIHGVAKIYHTGSGASVGTHRTIQLTLAYRWR